MAPQHLHISIFDVLNCNDDASMYGAYRFGSGNAGKAGHGGKGAWQGQGQGGGGWRDRQGQGQVPGAGKGKGKAGKGGFDAYENHSQQKWDGSVKKRLVCGDCRSSCPADRAGERCGSCSGEWKNKDFVFGKNAGQGGQGGQQQQQGGQQGQGGVRAEGGQPGAPLPQPDGKTVELKNLIIQLAKEISKKGWKEGEVKEQDEVLEKNLEGLIEGVLNPKPPEEKVPKDKRHKAARLDMEKDEAAFRKADKELQTAEIYEKKIASTLEQARKDTAAKKDKLEEARRKKEESTKKHAAILLEPEEELEDEGEEGGDGGKGRKKKEGRGKGGNKGMEVDEAICQKCGKDIAAGTACCGLGGRSPTPAESVATSAAATARGATGPGADKVENPRRRSRTPRGGRVKEDLDQQDMAMAMSHEEMEGMGEETRKDYEKWRKSFEAENEAKRRRMQESRQQTLSPEQKVEQDKKDLDEANLEAAKKAEAAVAEATRVAAEAHTGGLPQ